MSLRIATLVAQLVPGEKAIRLLPAGEFRSSDGSGRPKDAPAWYLDGENAAALVAAQQSRQGRPVIDYEHQTLLTAKNGQPAPAAGWIEGWEWRDDGLYIQPDWTERAAAMIAAGEYRYISPVFSYDRNGRVLDIKHAALTNNPGLDGLTDLAALSSLFQPTEESMAIDNALKARLCKMLHLPVTVSDEELGTALDKLAAKITPAGKEPANLTAYIDELSEQVAALKAADPDPAKYVPVATMKGLQDQVAVLTARINGDEAGRLIEGALAAGRLLPTQRDWAENLGKSNLAALKAYIDATPENPALSGMQTAGKELGAQKTQSDADVAVMKALDMTSDEFAVGKIEED